MEITTKDFGLGAHLICLTNKAGDTLSLSNYGARIVDWTVNGKKIVLGFDSTQELRKPYMADKIPLKANSGSLKSFRKQNKQKFNFT